MREAASDPLIQIQENIISSHGCHGQLQTTDEDIINNFFCRDGFMEEAKQQLVLALPLVAVNMLQYCLQVISVMFVGHLGELPLSSASVATSFASVTGFSVLLGMGSALETLCGQAYGAKQHDMLGVYTQRAILVLTALSVALAIVWYYTGFILVALGQDHEISAGAGEFNRWMIPGLFAYGILQCLVRFLQTQNIVVPMMITSAVAALLHVFVCWLFLFRLELGTKGAALANAFSYWMNVLFLASYVKLSKTCKKTFTGFSREAFRDIISFLRLAVPSAVMIWYGFIDVFLFWFLVKACKRYLIIWIRSFEYWSFEMVVILSGLLPNPKLETSVLSISLNTCWMVYMISVGLGGAVSTRVSNELGGGNSNRARLAICVAATIAASEGVIVGTTTILVRRVWGKLYSDEEEVIEYVARIMPLLALSDFLDGFQCVLSGAARGCGWQNLCATINLGAYYVVAIPSAVIFAFLLHIGALDGDYMWACCSSTGTGCCKLFDDLGQ
ncbi:protein DETOXIFICATION 16-like isoform X3 [Andrographis paniculata]|uniref:protein DETOXIFICATION 16-like isoform X3 n=1 Tax=Andrographis paniculata TaxID=175694 RepID=UPI0021E7307D|nr:protein DETOXIFICATION 16-like isoform X3 [Andrographis paniculata]